MKIAVASEKDTVMKHFGHCENFNIFETEGSKIISSESITNPGHRPGFLPRFLHELGIKVIISGGMGQGAVEIFNDLDIEVITGVEGRAKDAAEEYLAGSLRSTGEICHQHKHCNECE